MSTAVGTLRPAKRSPDMRKRYRRVALVVVGGIIALLVGLAVVNLVVPSETVPEWRPVERSQGVEPGR